MPQASVGYEMATIILYPTSANEIIVILETPPKYVIARTLATFVEHGISIRNSTVSRGIWNKYHEWYFKIYRNITSRCGE